VKVSSNISLFFGNVLFLCFISVLNFHLYATDTLFISRETKEVLIGTQILDKFDSLPGEKRTPIIDNTHNYLHNPDPLRPIWAELYVNNQSDTAVSMVFLSHFYSIDELEIWLFTNRGTQKYFFRDSIAVYNREIQHKHPSSTFTFPANSTSKFIIRLKNESSFEYAFVMYSTQMFFSKYFREYLLYGLFYGFLSFVIVSCLITFLFFRDPLILIYLICIAAQMFYMLYRDGNGLYLYPASSGFADLIKNISRGAMSVTLMMYTGLFLKIDRKSWMFRSLAVLVLFRIIYGLVMLEDTTRNTFHIEFFVILYCTFLAFRFYNRIDSETRYMAIGLSFLAFSYSFNYFSVLGLIDIGGWSFWSLYIGMAGENIFFTLAITERFKRMRVETFRQEQMNRELEHLVEQRTATVQMQNRLLEAQSTELNLFLYSASHDLKGPLKSIEGLCNVGMMDKESNHDELFDMIKNKLRKLESNIGDLNSVTKLKYYNAATQKIDFALIHQDLLERFEKFPGFDQISIELNLQFTEELNLDLFTIRSIYQNIVENAIKYRDTEKKSHLRISIFKQNELLHILFIDNGQGIAADKVDKIFDMFYRANDASREDTGLGLYIVKLAVEKLNGTISVKSELGIGTEFEIKIPV
jgi:signal transduction histidine kinase